MLNEHKITVKGIGNLRLKADWIKMSFSLNSENIDYSAGYEAFAKRIANLQGAGGKVGFDKMDLKSGSIYVATQYKNVKRRSNGESEYVQVFNGYRFNTELILSFDFDSEKLGEVIKAVVSSDADPKFEIEFTVKDKQAVINSLLSAAAKDAKAKADVLCTSLGASLGKLSSISYNWDEIEIRSHSSYKMTYNMVCDSVGSSPAIDFTPEDVEVEDSATFVWDIE